MRNFSNNLNWEYMSAFRHWHPGSEKYAGADCLLTAMENGWAIDGALYKEEFWLAGSRPVVVYHVTLRRGNERMVMPVISNPYMRRMINAMAPEVLPLASRESRQDETRQARR